MTSKAELGEMLESIVNDVRRRSGIPIPTPLPYTSQKFRELIRESIEIEKELLKVEDASEALLDLSGKVYELEARYRHLRARLMLMPSVLVVYGGFALVFAALRYLDITGFIKGTLGVEAPGKLIAFGVAGAFLYLATSILTKITSTKTDSQFNAIMAFTLRLSLAIVVPIILVSLFFTKEGTIANVKVSPELLSFACGYSAKLVMDIFNKIVEKGAKMIEAL